MPQYQAPLRDMQFVLHELLEVEKELAELPAHAEVNRELIDQVLEEGGKFCAEVLFPLNRSGDEEGCRYEGDGVVRGADRYSSIGGSVARTGLIVQIDFLSFARPVDGPAALVRWLSGKKSADLKYELSGEF